jgi:hypothetical protein
MEIKSLRGISASWNGDTCCERQRSCVMWSRVCIVNERWRSRGIRQALMECLLHNKSWGRGKGKLRYRQALPRLKYAVQSRVVPRLTVRLTSSPRDWVSSDSWIEKDVKGRGHSRHRVIPPLAWRDWGKVWETVGYFSLKEYEAQVLLTHDLCCHTCHHGVVQNWTEGLFCLSL